MASSEEEPAGARLRPLLAAVACLGALVLTGTPLTGPMSSYALTMPLLAACSCWLVQAIAGPRRGVAALAAAVLLLAPAAGFRVTRVGIDTFEATYLASQDALFHLLSIATYTPRGTGPLLLAGAVAITVAFGRSAAPVAGAALAGALGSQLSRLLLASAAGAWQAGDFRRASQAAYAAGAVGLLALVGTGLGLLAWRRPRPDRAGLHHAPSLLVVLSTLVAAWSSTPPIAALARTQPQPVASAPTLRAPPGRSVAAQVLQLDGAVPVPDQLADMGFAPVRDSSWPCDGRSPRRWAKTVRNLVAIAPTPETRVDALIPLIPVLYRHGVDSLAILALGPPLPGAYGARARWSAVPLLLDPPPPGVQWVRLSPEGPVLLHSPETAPDTGTCALLPDLGLSLDDLHRQARLLAAPGGEGPCQRALALVLPDRDGALSQIEGCASLPSPQDRSP